MDEKLSALNKSWETSLASLRKAMGGKKMDKMMDYGDNDMSKAGMGEDGMSDEDMMKGKKKKKDDSMKAENDSQMLSDETTSEPFHVAPDGGTGGGGGSTDHGSEGMKDPGKSGMMMRKSLMDRMAENNVVNVEPFLKSLVNNLDATNAETVAYLNGQLGALQKSISDMGNMIQAQADFTIANAELTKSLNDSVNGLQSAPIPPQGALIEGQVQERFQKSEAAPEPMNKSTVYSKMQELIKSEKIDLVDAAKIEGRVEKGLALGNEYAHLFA